MKNENGQYLVDRYMKATGALIRGYGKTMEEARVSFKANLKAYREALKEGAYLQPIFENGRDGRIVSYARISVAQMRNKENQR